jgi:hypothetical protein
LTFTYLVFSFFQYFQRTFLTLKLDCKGINYFLIHQIFSHFFLVFFAVFLRTFVFKTECKVKVFFLIYQIYFRFFLTFFSQPCRTCLKADAKVIGLFLLTKHFGVFFSKKSVFFLFLLIFRNIIFLF